MTETTIHKRIKAKAAGRDGRTEAHIRGKRFVDAVGSGGKKITEVELSGSSVRLKEAARRLRDRRGSQKVLVVPHKDLAKAREAMRKVGARGTARNLTGTKRSYVSGR